MDYWTKQAYGFFRSNGLRAATALALARAERYADRKGLVFEWMPDDEGAAEWDCDCGCVPDEVLGCVCRNERNECVASLWSIGDPSPEYQRIVQAELALEIMPE